MNSFNEFLRTGHFGIFDLGQVLEDIVDILGEPDLASKNKFFDIVKYGDFEITSTEGIISQIKISLRENGINFPDSLANQSWPISKSTKVEELIDMLNIAQVGWQINQELTFDRQLCISTESGVSIFFDFDFCELESLFVSENSKSKVIYQYSRDDQSEN